jgi:hypothetical protein
MNWYYDSYCIMSFMATGTIDIQGIYCPVLTWRAVCGTQWSLVYAYRTLAKSYPLCGTSLQYVANQK